MIQIPFSTENYELRGDDLESSLMMDRLNDEKFAEVRNDPDLFWGIRYKYINIYFMGASIAKIEVKKGQLNFSVASRYLEIPGKITTKFSQALTTGLRASISYATVLKKSNIKGKEKK